MRLFDMTDSQLDSMVQAHYDRLLDQHLKFNDMYCCNNCLHYCKSTKICSIAEEQLDEAELELMYKEETFGEIMCEPDDYCKDFEPYDDEPPYDEDDR